MFFILRSIQLHHLNTSFQVQLIGVKLPDLQLSGVSFRSWSTRDPLGQPKAGRSFHLSIGHQSPLGFTCIISGSTQLLHHMDLIDSLLSELEQDSGLRTPSPPFPSITTPPPPSLPFSSSSPSCKSPPPPSYSTSPREALQFPHLILSGTSPKELPSPSLNTSSPIPQLHCLITNAGKNFLKKFLVYIIFQVEFLVWSHRHSSNSLYQLSILHHPWTFYKLGAMSRPL